MTEVQAERVAESQLVLSERPGLVGAEYVHPRQFLDRNQFAHNRLSLGEQTGANRHRHRQDRRHRHGNGRDRQHQRELQYSQDRLAAVNSKSDDHRHEDQREDDQIVADLQHGFLEMADRDRRLHQFRRLAEIGFAAGRVDQRVDFAATNDRPGEDGVARLAGGGQGFPGQRRLVDRDLVAVQEARVGRHDIAQAQANGVARHEFARRRIDPLPIAFHPGLDRQRRLQSRDGVAGLMLFPESDHCVGKKQNEDDAEVRPMLGRRRQDHRRFDHPGYRTPEIGEELHDLVGLRLRDLVRPILDQALLRLGFAEALGRRRELFLDLRQRPGLQIVIGDRLRSRLGLASLGPIHASFHDRNSFWHCCTLAILATLCEPVRGASRHAEPSASKTHRNQLPGSPPDVELRTLGLNRARASRQCLRHRRYYVAGDLNLR